jgi:hypothetical protein
LKSGLFAEDSDGNDVDPTDEDACRWCALGALAKAADMRGVMVIHTQYSDYLRSAIAEIESLEGKASITHWNDEGILNVEHWNRAIELAEACE